MQAFFQRLSEGEKKPGFPRVKPRHQFFTLCYPAMYLEVQGKTITLPTGGGHSWGPKRYPNIVTHLTEEPPEHFREVAVSRGTRELLLLVWVRRHRSKQPGRRKQAWQEAQKTQDPLHTRGWDRCLRPGHQDASHRRQRPGALLPHRWI
jgi:hypothetical protein